MLMGSTQCMLYLLPGRISSQASNTEVFGLVQAGGGRRRVADARAGGSGGTDDEGEKGWHEGRGTSRAMRGGLRQVCERVIERSRRSALDRAHS